MTKIPLTTTEKNEISDIRNSVGTFELPIDADLELRNSDNTYATVYGTTDPEIEASMVNVRYLHDQINNSGNQTQNFRRFDPTHIYYPGDAAYTTEDQKIWYWVPNVQSVPPTSTPAPGNAQWQEIPVSEEVQNLVFTENLDFGFNAVTNVGDTENRASLTSFIEFSSLPTLREDSLFTVENVTPTGQAPRTRITYRGSVPINMNIQGVGNTELGNVTNIVRDSVGQVTNIAVTPDNIARYSLTFPQGISVPLPNATRITITGANDLWNGVYETRGTRAVGATEVRILAPPNRASFTGTSNVNLDIGTISFANATPRAITAGEQLYVRDANPGTLNGLYTLEATNQGVNSARFTTGQGRFATQTINTFGQYVSGGTVEIYDSPLIVRPTAASGNPFRVRLDITRNGVTAGGTVGRDIPVVPASPVNDRIEFPSGVVQVDTNDVIEVELFAFTQGQVASEPLQVQFPATTLFTLNYTNPGTVFRVNADGSLSVTEVGQVARTIFNARGEYLPGLNGLADVNIPAPLNGQTPVWNAQQNEWIAASADRIVTPDVVLQQVLMIGQDQSVLGNVIPDVNTFVQDIILDITGTDVTTGPVQVNHTNNTFRIAGGNAITFTGGTNPIPVSWTPPPPEGFPFDGPQPRFVAMLVRGVPNSAGMIVPTSDNVVATGTPTVFTTDRGSSTVTVPNVTIPAQTDAVIYQWILRYTVAAVGNTTFINFPGLQWTLVIGSSNIGTVSADIRGNQFIINDDGTIVYTKGGAEPRVFAGPFGRIRAGNYEADSIRTADILDDQITYPKIGAENDGAAGQALVRTETGMTWSSISSNKITADITANTSLITLDAATAPRGITLDVNGVTFYENRDFRYQQPNLFLYRTLRPGYTYEITGLSTAVAHTNELDFGTVPMPTPISMDLGTVPVPLALTIDLGEL